VARVWFLAKAIAIRDSNGKVVRWLGTNTDITEQLQVQEALRQANERLEERVRERTVELTEMVRALQNEIHQRREAEQQLHAAYEQLSVRAGQLRALTAELTLAEQRERRRLATILHDHLQQLLVGAKLRVAVLARKGDKLINDAAAEIDKLLTESIRASRSLTTELDPPVLHEKGLRAGLEWLADWMRDKYAFCVRMVAPEPFAELPPDITVFVFESLRELLFNAVKHGQVSEADVLIRQAGENLLQVEVIDKGVGFDPASMMGSPKKEGGFGLFSIRDRIGLLGGEMRVNSEPGKGTRIEFTVPFRHALLLKPAPRARSRHPATRRPLPTTVEVTASSRLKGRGGEPALRGAVTPKTVGATEKPHKSYVI